MLSRQKLITIFKNFFKVLEDDFSVVSAALISLCEDIQASELYEDIKRYFDLEFVDGSITDLDDVKRSFAQSRDVVMKQLENNSWSIFIDDLEKAMGWLFDKDQDDEVLNNIFGDDDDIIIPAQSLKIGRNELCPCGSEKKYKKCCL